MVYTAEEYLLDRRFIEDTSHRLWLLLDLQLPRETYIERTINEVLCSTVHVDYKSLRGTSPKKWPAQGLSEQWAGLGASLDGTLHLTSCVVPFDLPTPGNAQRPDEAVVHVKAITTLTKGDAMTQNQAIVELTLRRIEDLEGNAWRIAKLKSLNVAYNGGEPQKVFGDH